MKVYISNTNINNSSKDFLRGHGALAEVLPHSDLPLFEACHADMQFSKIDSSTLIFAPESKLAVEDKFLEGIDFIQGKTNLKSKYPYNIPYNILRFNNYLVHNTLYTDESVLQEAKKRLLVNIKVKQGYSGCSSIAIPLHNGSSLVLSSDKGIIAALKAFNIPTEYFNETESILLPGYNHGFIGGCCGYDDDLGLLVYGKINGQLKKLSETYEFPVLSIFDGPLTDIGGILIMYPNL